jgi:hypothetical protein
LEKAGKAESLVKEVEQVPDLPIQDNRQGEMPT